MLSPSLAMVVVVVIGGIAALIALGWAVARGWVSDEAIRNQATSIFDTDDLTGERPWETAAQRTERISAYGPGTQLQRGSFGGDR